MKNTIKTTTPMIACFAWLLGPGCVVESSVNLSDEGADEATNDENGADSDSDDEVDESSEDSTDTSESAESSESTESTSTDTTDSESTDSTEESTDTGGNDVEAEEQDGLLVFEAENTWMVDPKHWNNEWVLFEAGTPEYTDCPAQSPCPGDPKGECNPYADCDDDFFPAEEQSGGAYMEMLPNRRRDDHEEGTGANLGVTNNPHTRPMMWYRVRFTSSGRFYAWVRAFGKGPADNGLWLGFDDNGVAEDGDFKPEMDIPDYAGMRFQLKGGWQWQNCRRGQNQHTGVNNCNVEENMMIDVPAPGVYNILIGMREDGVDVDKFVFSKDPNFVPEGLGPDVTP